MDRMPDNDPMEKQPPLSGLDPADLLRQGVADDTILEGAPPASPPPSLEELAAAFPQFEILELIGQGGMGAVYKVRQKDLDRIVALKILSPAISQSPEFSERFTREARALAKLNHPGIVTIHEFGQRDGLYFILMELVDGVNLAQLMKTGRVSPREALAIVPQICDALQYAHDQGIVHRDIKPENLLLDRKGGVKVADFGIAKVMAAACDPERSGDIPVPENQTLAGKIIGTPQYMAPEQIERPNDVDHRADIYALGVVFYQMLTGELPGKELQAPSKKVHIDVRLDEIVLRAMEKRPEMRYQTANELRTVVDGFPAPAHSQPPSLPIAAPKRGMMRRWWWVFLVMIPLGPIIGLATGAGWASLVPKKYETAATIEIRPQNVEGMTPGWIGNEFEKLTSRRLLTDVAEQLDLPAKWQVNRDEAVGILKGIITVENIRGTDLMRVRVRHTNNEQAVDIANGVVSSYQRSFGGTVIVHDVPLRTTFPVSPNVRLLLVLGALGGLLLFPLMAVLLILMLNRAFPEKNPADVGRDSELGSSQKEAATRDITAPNHRKSPFRSKKILWILAVCLVTGVLWITLGNSGRSYPVSSTSSAFKTPVMGRIEFKYTHAESLGGKSVSYDVKMWGDTQWKPSSGMTITLKDGQSLQIKSRVNAMNPDSPMAMVTTSSDNSNWETKELKIGGVAPGQHMVFGNGLRVEILWTPVATPARNPERPDPVQMQVMQQASKWSDEMHPVKVDAAPSVENSGMPTENKLADYIWDEMAANGRFGDAVKVSVDGRTCLKIENPNDGPMHARLLTVAAPPIKSKRYALRGEIRYENVEGSAYLKMWSDFPQGRFFSRTLGEPGSGPMSQLTGTSSWRGFLLPFDRTKTANPPNRIELNLYLPGKGVVFVGSLELIDIEPDEEVSEDKDGEKSADSALERISFRELPAANRLQIRLVAPGDPQAVPAELRQKDRTTVPLKLSEDVVICDRHVKDAGIQKTDERYDILITLDDEGAKRMAAATKGADGVMRIAILVDGRVIMAPVVQSQLGSRFVVSGLGGFEECLGLVRNLVEWPDGSDFSSMTEWLEKIDQGDAGEAWTMASEYFRQNVTREKWQEMATAARHPLGKLVTRQPLSSKQVESPPGAPEGPYLVNEFESSFENKKGAREVVTLKKDNDGRWRVCGYFIL